MDENEKLLVEKRELLKKMSDAEEMGSTGMRTASTVQHRVKVLEVENRQLQDRTLLLSNQVGSLERALRHSQPFYNLEHDVRKMFPSESLTGDCTLHTSSLSLTPSTCDALGILDTICRMKAGERVMEVSQASFSIPPPQPSELGYLNVTSPMVPPGTKDAGQSPREAPG